MRRIIFAAAGGIGLAAGLADGGSHRAHAAPAGPGVVKHITANATGQHDVLAANPNAEGANFAPGDNVFASPSGAPYQVDVNGSYRGNDVLVTTQNGFSSFSGLGFTISISNGENGDGVGIGGSSGYGYKADGGSLAGSSPSNPTAADPVFAAIGNPSGKLENGNVVRFSTWVRKDPAAPLVVEPQIPPIVKLEFWRDALSGHADFTGGVPNPNFGSRIFDTDQNGVAIADAGQRARILDINGDGAWTFGATTEKAPVATAWQQIVHRYVVNSIGDGWDIDPFNLDPTNNPPFVEDVTYVEEIRAVVFMGDYTGSNLGGPGNLLWDNALVEVFRNVAAEAASDVKTTNPSPLLDEKTQDPDFNADRRIDGRDLLIWQAGFPRTTGGTTATGDANYNGTVDAADLAIWAASFGTVAPAVAAAAAIPEPHAAVLAGIGLAAAGALPRRRTR